MIGIIACGMTFAIILGGFDLSVGSVDGAGERRRRDPDDRCRQLGIPVGIAGASLLPASWSGAINGWLIAYLGVNPFVATLGTMTVVRGLIYVATNASPRFGVPYSFTVVGLGYILGHPRSRRSSFAIVAVVLGFVLHQTRFGHYVYAVGGNVVAAAEMGINAAAGPLRRLCAGLGLRRLSGIILIGQTASATPQAALGYELTAIAAVIVGGASLGGGRGRMIGTIIGVFLLGVVANALNLFGVSPFWQPVATGLILIFAVAFDGFSRRGMFALSK